MRRGWRPRGPKKRRRWSRAQTEGCGRASVSSKERRRCGRALLSQPTSAEIKYGRRSPRALSSIPASVKPGSAVGSAGSGHESPDMALPPRAGRSRPEAVVRGPGLPHGGQVGAHVVGGEQRGGRTRAHATLRCLPEPRRIERAGEPVGPHTVTRVRESCGVAGDGAADCLKGDAARRELGRAVPETTLHARGLPRELGRPSPGGNRRAGAPRQCGEGALRRRNMMGSSARCRAPGAVRRAGGRNPLERSAGRVMSSAAGRRAPSAALRHDI